MTTYAPSYTVGYMNGGNRMGIMCTGSLVSAMGWALELRERGDAPYMAIDGDCVACKGSGTVYPGRGYPRGVRVAHDGKCVHTERDRLPSLKKIRRVNTRRPAPV